MLSISEPRNHQKNKRIHTHVYYSQRRAELSVVMQPLKNMQQLCSGCFRPDRILRTISLRSNNSQFISRVARSECACGRSDNPRFTRQHLPSLDGCKGPTQTYPTLSTCDYNCTDSRPQQEILPRTMSLGPFSSARGHTFTVKRGWNWWRPCATIGQQLDSWGAMVTIRIYKDNKDSL